MEKTSLIHQQINTQSTISEGLEAMREYKCWSQSTLMSYRKDIAHFEAYLHAMKMAEVLENGKLHLVQRWIKLQWEQGVAFTTIKRRIASLSSVFSFYQDIGVVNQNCFKAVGVPPGHSEHHSPILELEQLKSVYSYADRLPQQQIYISPTIKMLIFTGLRNEALTNIQVRHIDFSKALLHVTHDALSINSKHKVQIIPLPPKLLTELEKHISDYKLLPEDKLLFGLSGLPLGDKALNRLTNHMSNELGWRDAQRITPHGFRATISTILSERGVDLSAIKFLLGHSEQDNLQFYIRQYGRHIRQLRRELTRIEEELSQVPPATQDSQGSYTSSEAEEKKGEGRCHVLPREVLLKLLEVDPELAVIMIQKGLAHV